VERHSRQATLGIEDAALLVALAAAAGPPIRISQNEYALVRLVPKDYRQVAVL